MGSCAREVGREVCITLEMSKNTEEAGEESVWCLRNTCVGAVSKLLNCTLFSSLHLNIIQTMKYLKTELIMLYEHNELSLHFHARSFHYILQPEERDKMVFLPIPCSKAT